MRFHSKIDAWLKVVLAAAVIVQLGVCLLVGLEGGTLAALSVWVTGLVLDAAIFGIFVVPMYYEITPSDLLVRSGVLRWHVPLTGIESIRPTHNPLSAPALSVDRLQVDYRSNGSRKTVLISPVDRSGFLERLATSVPGLVREGDGLKRRG